MECIWSALSKCR